MPFDFGTGRIRRMISATTRSTTRTYTATTISLTLGTSPKTPTKTSSKTPQAPGSDHFLLTSLSIPIHTRTFAFETCKQQRG